MENSHAKSRVIENPVNGEKVTFLKTTEETNGEYLQLEIELAPHGKTPAHYHTVFTEKFKVIDGELTLLVEIRYKNGDFILRAYVPYFRKFSFFQSYSPYFRIYSDYGLFNSSFISET